MNEKKVKLENDDTYDEHYKESFKRDSRMVLWEKFKANGMYHSRIDYGIKPSK